MIIKILISALASFILYWFSLPALNWRSVEFWFFVIEVLVIFIAVNGFAYLLELGRALKIVGGTKFRAHNISMPKSKIFVGTLCVLGAIILFIIGGGIVGMEIFNATSYRDLITISDGNFSEDISELSMSQIPVVDRDTASRLGKRKLGEMSDLVSQFEILEHYTQINYNGSPYRVTPLAYGDPIKWLGNQKEGIPAYIMVDMATQETSLVRLSEGMKYSPSEYFLRNLDRALRFKFPTKIFDTISFEIDDEGTPYWIAPTISYKIGIWSGKDIDGAVLMNAITGESKFYALPEIPTWVDQVFVSNLVVEQLNYNGKFRSGFWNSIFGQRGVLQTTEGYNYIAINDDVYIYTGMTSVAGDESNVGFVLSNMRTKETKFYTVPGAEEYSAMGSAQGQVQHLGYTATFPLLLNIGDRPTYFMSLKDSAGLVKMYAFVDVERYQIVGTGATVNEAKTNYMSKLSGENISSPGALKEASGNIAAISSAVVDSNTIYYILLEEDATVYTVKLEVSPYLPFFKAGDNVKMSYSEINEIIASVSDIAIVPAE